MELDKLTRIAETLDRLMSMDIPARGIISVLYEAAREKTGRPLTMAAVDLLQASIRPGKNVIIATGWVDQPVVVPGHGESDGPPGAVALAKALRLGLKAAPIIVTDECLVEGVKQVARSAGFQCVRPEDIIHSIERNKLMTIAVLPFSADEEEARRQAAEMVAALKPAACIAIERGGMNSVGVVHNMSGQNAGEGQAKIDYLFQAARTAGVATLGIGDGGNEIGMANIAEAVRTRVPHGTECQCPCGEGIAVSTPVDVLVTATVSNWGAYAVAALLGLNCGVPAAIHDPVMERRMLEATAAACFHDPITGLLMPGADGCGLDVHIGMVTLLKEAVLQGQARYK